MISPQELQAAITCLPLNEQFLLCDQLAASIDASVELHELAADRADLALMEKRLDEYEAGMGKGDPWDVVEMRIRERLSL